MKRKLFLTAFSLVFLLIGSTKTSAGETGESPLSSSFGAVKSPSFTLSATACKQGEVLELVVDTDNLAQAGSREVEFLGRKYPLYPDENSNGQPVRFYRALLPVPVVEKTGKKKVLLGCLSQSINVVSANYPVQRLTLPSSKNNFIMAKGEEEAVDGAKATSSALRFWQGNFVHPSKARISAGFGLRRIVNGKLLDDYFHSGLDYAGGLGSPIGATAAGKVVLASGSGFKLHGNTVAIDHGQGVVSFYIHMQKVKVKEGQLVKAGEKIGTIGQTGRANGPHLHFSIYCNKVASNPWLWYRKAF